MCVMQALAFRIVSVCMYLSVSAPLRLNISKPKADSELLWSLQKSAYGQSNGTDNVTWTDDVIEVTSDALSLEFLSELDDLLTRWFPMLRVYRVHVHG